MSAARNRNSKYSCGSNSSEGDDGQDSDLDTGPSAECPPGTSARPVAKSGPSELKNFALVEFNKNRKIIVRNIPPVKYEVQRLYLQKFYIVLYTRKLPHMPQDSSVCALVHAKVTRS